MPCVVLTGSGWPDKARQWPLRPAEQLPASPGLGFSIHVALVWLPQAVVRCLEGSYELALEVPQSDKRGFHAVGNPKRPEDDRQMHLHGMLRQA